MSVGIGGIWAWNILACGWAQAVEPPGAGHAGRYRAEDDRGGRVVVELGAAGEFHYLHEGDAPRRYAGRWRVEEDVIFLEPVYDEKNDPFPRMPVRWKAIRWGPRRYLVPEGKLIQFCNAVNLGDEPRDTPKGPTPLREGDWGKPASGRPGLSDEWAPFILEAPLSGRIIDFEEDGYARLSLGGNQGLQAGMLLVAHHRGIARCCRVKVVCPCENEARVEIVCEHECGFSEASPGDLALDDAVSTTKAVLMKTTPITGSIHLVWVPEMREYPVEFPDSPTDTDQAVSESFQCQWASIKDRIQASISPEEVEGLARWPHDGLGRSPALRTPWIDTLSLKPIARSTARNEVLFGHELETGVPLLKTGPVHRRLTLAAGYDARAGRITVVYVTIRGWAEE